MPLPKQVRFVTFDCYGTLIDWETAAFEAFQKEAERDGFTVDKATLAALYLQAQQVRSYKPDPAHFKECQRRIGGKAGWVHVASGYETDVLPCVKLKVPVIWVNRKGQELGPADKKPTEEVKTLRDAAKLLGVA